ncbi:hypothetical protein [uncultured Algoriphagus sp.]
MTYYDFIGNHVSPSEVEDNYKSGFDFAQPDIPTSLSLRFPLCLA